MDWINYHHLLYFRTVIKEGSIAKACRVLNISQPAISTQLKTLEDTLGEKLLVRSGRGLVPTEAGQWVYRYADEIFSIGQEMMETIRRRPTGRTLKLHVGVADVVPKRIAFELLRPALDLEETIQLVCVEDRIDRLLSSLAVHELDVVLADTPIPPTIRVNGFSHLLGGCGISIVGTPALAKRYRKNFPRSLEDAPFLLPFEGTALRASLERWFKEEQFRPQIRGEFEDSALLKAFGQRGVGLFAVPSVIERQVIRDYGVARVGKTQNVRENFYALSMERRFKNPAVVALVESAKKKLFT